MMGSHRGSPCSCRWTTRNEGAQEECAEQQGLHGAERAEKALREQRLGRNEVLVVGGALGVT